MKDNNLMLFINSEEDALTNLRSINNNHSRNDLNQHLSVSEVSNVTK